MTNSDTRITTPTTVLISGASIAGLATAYWLDRRGFTVTVVERAAGLRPGGQAVDVRGTAIDVIERMGLSQQLRDNSTKMRGMSMVDGDGTEVFRSTESTMTGGDLDNADVEIMRDDLCELLRELAGVRIEYLFDDSITAVSQRPDGVDVDFENRSRRAFDLVIGADGLHSNTRKLVFGPEQRFVTHLGTYLAVFTTPNFLDLDHWQIFCQMPGSSWGGGIMSARNNTEARAYLGFQSEEPLDYDYRDVKAQQRILAEAFEQSGWEFPRMLEFMPQATDFHFDSMSQVKLDSWSSGRVALVGDAGYCGSPLSGQGTSMALVGAYVLAAELAAADGDHITGFAAYESELRDFVAANQQLALDNKLRVDAQLAGEAPPEDLPDAATVYSSYAIG